MGEEEHIQETKMLDNLDVVKLKYVLRKSLIWIVMIFMLTIFIAYLYLRYTKPVYESSSKLKLDTKTQQLAADFSGASTFQKGENVRRLSGEIELLKSKIIYDEVIRKMDLDVSYYFVGKVLYEEKYKTSPFYITYPQKGNSILYDQPISVKLLEQEKLQVLYKQDGQEDIVIDTKFKDTVVVKKFKFVIHKRGNLSKELLGEYFFKVNSIEALNNYITERLSIEILNVEANTIGISFRDNNPFKAAEFVNTIDSVYLQTTIENKQKTHVQTINFIHEQINKTREGMDDAQGDIESFIRKEGTADPTSEFGLLRDEMTTINQRANVLNSKIELFRTLREIVISEQEVSIPSLQGLEDQQVQNAINTYNGVRNEYEKLSASVMPNTLAYKNKKLELEAAKATILGNLTENEKILNKQLKNELRNLKELKSRFLQLPSKEAEYSKLKRYHDLHEKFLLLLLEKEIEYKIAKEGTVPEFDILTIAKPSYVPVYPNIGKTYLFAIVISIILSLSLLFAKYVFQNTIISQADLERHISVPVLGAVPKYLKEKLKVSKLVVDKNPKSSISEALRSIRTNLEFIVSGKEKTRLFSVTSTISGEGKTFVAINLGGVIAMSKYKVIIIDADMRKPKVHEGFNSLNEKGLSTILIGKHSIEDCIQNSDLENLDYITAGPVPPNPSELISRNEFNSLIEELKKSYDVIFIDTPPVGLVTDAQIVMQKVDVPIYIVRADYSKKGSERNINNLSKTKRFKNLSVILNAVSKANSYGYGYGYGYGYYDDDPEKRSSFSLRNIFKK